MIKSRFILYLRPFRAVFMTALLFAFVYNAKAQVPSTDTTVTIGIDTVTENPPDNEVDYSEDTSTDYTPEVKEPDTVSFRNVPDTVVTALQKKKEFEYANDPEYWLKHEKPDNESRSVGFLEWLFFNPFIKILMYILLAAVLLFAVYKIIVNNNLFYRGAKKKQTEAAIDEDVEIETDLESKIAKAIQTKEYRKAIRYLYVKSLREMDQKNLIRYHAQATNYDYLAQVSEFRFAGTFSFLTQVYDYVWYGGFEISDEQFDKVLKDFNDFYKVIGSW